LDKYSAYCRQPLFYSPTLTASKRIKRALSPATEDKGTIQSTALDSQTVHPDAQDGSSIAHQIESDYLLHSRLSDDLVRRIKDKVGTLEDKDLLAVLLHTNQSEVNALLHEIADTCFSQRLPFARKSTSEVGVKLLPYVSMEALTRRVGDIPAGAYLFGKKQKFTSLQTTALSILVERLRQSDLKEHVFKVKEFVKYLSMELPAQTLVFDAINAMHHHVDQEQYESLLNPYMQHPPRPLLPHEIDFFIHVHRQLGPVYMSHIYRQHDALIAGNKFNPSFDKLPGLLKDLRNARSDKKVIDKEPIRRVQDRIGMYIGSNFFKREGLVIDVSNPGLRYGFDLLIYDMNMNRHHVEVKTIQLDQSNPRLFITPYEKSTFGQSRADGIKHSLFVVELYDNAIHAIKRFEDLQFDESGHLIDDREQILLDNGGLDYIQFVQRIHPAQSYSP
jgi:hypothetical protein